jgi:hypothetical protein
VKGISIELRNISAHDVRARVFSDRTVRTWQFIAVATTLYFGSAAPAVADELPLVPVPADAAAVVETITAEVAPEVAPLVAEVTAPQPDVAAVVANEPTPTPVPQPEATPESQYHQPESQYQAPSVLAESTSGEPDAAATTEAAELTADPAATSTTTAAAAQSPTPTAATVDESAASATGAPDTWVWNWTWNCDPQSAPPAQLPVDADAPNWVWNWSWNCDAEPNAGGDSAQYQGGASQYQPGNTNVSIRIGSPGDNGPVTQTIAAAAAAVATSVSTLAQTVVSTALGESGSAPPPVATPPPVVVPPLPPLVIGPLDPFVEPALVALPPISLPALPPLEISLPAVVGAPVATAIAEAVEQALGATGVEVAATGSAAAPPPGAAASTRPLAVTARVPQHVAGIVAGASWSAPPPVQPSGARSSAGSSPTRQGFPPRPSLPRPNAPALGGAQMSSSASGVLAAFAALLAAYFLFPVLTARRLRVPRERRLLRPRASRFDPPG